MVRLTKFAMETSDKWGNAKSITPIVALVLGCAVLGVVAYQTRTSLDKTRASLEQTEGQLKRRTKSFEDTSEQLKARTEELKNRTEEQRGQTELLVSTSNAAASLKVDLEAQTRESQDLRAKLNEANAALAKKPVMPIRAAIRTAVFGDGLVLSIHNQSNRNLAFVVTCTNPTLNSTRSFRMDIAAGLAKELGHLEGWKFASGDVVRVSHNDYEPAEIKVK